MKKMLRLGVVGCGDIAQYMAWITRLNRHVQISACCDVSPERVHSYAQRFKIPSKYTDYTQMIAEGQMDAVYLAVPHHLHYSMLQTAIQHSLAAWVEKPITRTLDEGVQIAQFARQKDVKVGVNYQYRYDRGCYALARAAQKGELGQIHYARINLPWHREQGYFSHAAWHARLDQAGGGTLITQGSHLLDVALWALGERPKNAMGFITQRRFDNVEVEDLAQGIVETEKGIAIQVCSSMVANPEQAISIEIYGEKGTARYTNAPWPRVRFRGVRVKIERPPFGGLHALQRSLEGFRAWVMEDRPYLIPAKEALPVLGVVEAIYRSAESGQREPVVNGIPARQTKI